MNLALLALVPLTASLAVASSADRAVGESCDGRPATIIAVAGRPTTGTEGDDVIVGTDGPDEVLAQGGNDVVCGLGGADVLRGGAGDDRLFGGLSGRDENGTYLADVLVPGAGDDILDVGLDPEALTTGPEDNGRGFDSISWEDSSTGVTIDLVAGTAVGEGSDTIVVQPAISIVGSSHSDTVTGSDRDDLVAGGRGNDVVTTGGGNDSVVGGGGDDRIDTGDADDYVSVGSGADDVVTGSGADSVHVRRGAAPTSTILTGGGRDDVLMDAAAAVDTGNGRDEWLMVLRRGGEPFDVAGGPGRDRLDVVVRGFTGERVTWDNARGRVTSGAALLGRTSGLERFVLPDRARWTFIGDGSDESVDAYSFAAPVLMLGRGGDDDLSGTNGADVLDGGTGRDVLRGHAGRDVCRAGEDVRRCERIVN